MSYFVRDNARHQSPQRRAGKKVGGPVDVPPVKEVPSRDQVIERNIAEMNRNANPGDGGVLRFVHGREVGGGAKTRNPHHRPDSDIFGPPVISPRPNPRIRPGVTDEELQRIWAEDEKKQVAAKKMEAAPTLVDRMVADPINPVMKSARAKDAPPPPRKIVHLLSETTEERNRQAFEPAGFSGMGKQCKDGGRQGRSCKPPEEYIPPELQQKPRVQGRRTKFPKDTFSFQEESQSLQS
uniref:Uncharacterized protein n=1 Tax=Neobodo designis TaxID=312471 RepID=A0A7S1QEX8_NEODS|mmetsp:Transcript_44020/g.135876  ORF Transcript_44020/g.135876 Transcript_44020/m.135876 type:complete len:238 (+) Transcript_44020:148-861(+)|eukprot:CAMPEP_0174828260 /NCGR_PEP_ID=MMETSP1114-20130205/1220_1 /TAXON_ID=312471 /ORGANISM="Neobodo designis, Strain CCAP 1951/1" /LENGTH=237 /DNA_ID=CAMNT_0016061973 /DNA_START=150 /DNA_END=863 /DNA_ORIENTATION=-